VVFDVVEIWARLSVESSFFGSCCTYRCPHSLSLPPSSSSLALGCVCCVRYRMTSPVVSDSVRLWNLARVLTMSCMWEEERGTDRCFCALDESTSSRMRSGGHSLNDEGSHVYRRLPHIECAHAAVRRRQSRRQSHQSSRLSPWLDHRRRVTEMDGGEEGERG
jgi:hypothetical protein